MKKKIHFNNKKQIYDKKKNYNNKKKRYFKKYIPIKEKIKKYKIQKKIDKILNFELEKEARNLFLLEINSRIEKKTSIFFSNNFLLSDNYFKLNFGRVKKNRLNFNFLIKTYSKMDLYHNIKINLKFDINFLNFLVLNKENIFLKKRWKFFSFFFLRKKIIRNKYKKLRYRILFNTNLEINLDIFAYIIISKEFFNFPKFLKLKPHYFTNRTNKFVRHFF